MAKDKARDYTDRKLNELEKALSREYSRAKSEIEAEWKDFTKKHGAKAEELHNALLAARHSGDSAAIKDAKEKYQAEMKRITTGDKRYKQMVQETADKLAHIDKLTYDMANNVLGDVYAVNYNDINIPAGYSFKLVDSKTVSGLALGEIDLLKDERWNKQRLNGEIMQGILRGESMDKIANRISPMVDGNRAAAIRNARTAVTHAENQGRLDSMVAAEKECGLIYEKQWIATNDSRTRESHAEMHGETVPLDEPFTNGLMCPADPDGDPEEVFNCRCTMNRVLVGRRKPDDVADEMTADAMEEAENWFTPAQSIEEAEAFMSQYIDKDRYFGATGLSYSGMGLDAANEVNRVLGQFQRDFDVGKWGGIIAPAGNTKYGKMMTGATAAYSPISNSFILNRKTFKSLNASAAAFEKEASIAKDLLTHPEKYDLSKLSRSVQKVIADAAISGRTTIPTNIEEALWHELGHSLEKSVRKSGLYDTIVGNMPSFAPQLSGYACQDKGEYIAESFCSWMKGENKVDPVLGKVFGGLKRNG